MCPVKILLEFVNRDLFYGLHETRLQVQSIVLLVSIGIFIKLLSLARQRRTSAAREKEPLGKVVWHQILAQHPHLAYGKNVLAVFSCACILFFALLTCFYLKCESTFAAAYLASHTGQFELAERIYAISKRSCASSFAELRCCQQTTTEKDAQLSIDAMTSIYGRESKEMADLEFSLGLSYALTRSSDHRRLNHAKELYLKLNLLNQAIDVLACHSSLLCFKHRDVASSLVKEAVTLYPRARFPIDYSTNHILKDTARRIGDEEALKVFATAELRDSRRISSPTKKRGFVDATIIAILLPLLPFMAFGLGTATVKELILWRQSLSLEKRYDMLSQTLSAHGKAEIWLPAAAETESNAPKQEHRWQLMATLNSQIDLALYRGDNWLAERKSLQLLKVAEEGTTSGIEGKELIRAPESDCQRRWMPGIIAGIIWREAGCLALIVLFVIIHIY